MERLLHIYLAVVGVLLFLLVSRASSAALPKISSRGVNMNIKKIVGVYYDGLPHSQSSGRHPPIGSLRSHIGMTTQHRIESSLIEPRTNPASMPTLHQPPTEDDMRKLRMERFKSQVLSKLNMKERPPQGTIRMDDLPSNTSKGFDSEMFSTEPPSSSPNTIILSTKNVHCRGHRSPHTSCFAITLDGSLSEGVLKSSLRFWRTEDERRHDGRHHILVVRQIANHHTRHSHRSGQDTTVSYEVATLKPGWVEVDVTKMVRAWASDGLTEAKIEISCPSCSGSRGLTSNRPEHLPSISATLQEPKVRYRRATKICSTDSDDGKCCRAVMNVTPSDMGWSDWIIGPHYFSFYYCRGHCVPPTPSLDGTSSNMSMYNELLQNLYYRQKPGSPEQTALEPCCSPTSFTSMDVVYEKNGEAFRDTLNDIIVGSCGCNG